MDYSASSVVAGAALVSLALLIYIILLKKKIRKYVLRNDKISKYFKR